jgi:hypothetical protein
MKNNSLVFLGFALICLVNLNSHHRVPVVKPAQPVPNAAKVAVTPVMVQPRVAKNAAELAEVPAAAPKKTFSVSRPVTIHKLRDRQSEAIDASESGPKDDKIARPL